MFCRHIDQAGKWAVDDVFQTSDEDSCFADSGTIPPASQMTQWFQTSDEDSCFADDGPYAYCEAVVNRFRPLTRIHVLPTRIELCGVAHTVTWFQTSDEDSCFADPNWKLN